MKKYNILGDFEKQKKLKEVEEEKERLQKPTYWILSQMGIPKSTYYDWLGSGGVSKSKAPHAVWNKSLPSVEEKGIIITSVGVWGVLKRKGKSREFVEEKDKYIIYPKSEKFLGVVCIDDIMLTTLKPRDTAIFNAIDEFSQESVAISYVPHRSNRYDVVELLEKIFDEYGKYPDTVRLDNAKAHISIYVKEFCVLKGIKLQFIDKGVPQQNWPVESFNGVLEKDTINTSLWKWHESDEFKQKMLDDYRDYYNNQKRLDSDPLKRTPHEIATAITSRTTQNRLKLKLLRKHRGQVAAQQYMLSNSLFST